MQLLFTMYEALCPCSRRCQPLLGILANNKKNAHEGVGYYATPILIAVIYLEVNQVDNPSPEWF